MKKIISIMLALVISLSVFAVPSFAKEKTDYSKNINMLSSMGLLSPSQMKLKNDDEVTRIEFAKILVSVLSLKVANTQYEQKFIDLDSKQSGYSEVMALVSLNYMAGYADDTFKPDNKITGIEAAKILVNILGYKYKALSYGGYPDGYYRCANEIDLLTGVTLSNTESATWGEITRLIDNALDIPLVELKTIGGDQEYAVNKDVTLLTKNLKMKRDKGIITANDLVSIKGYATAGDDLITIDGISYVPKTDKEQTMLGLKVTYVYKIDEDKINRELVCVIEDEKNKVITINRDDYLSLDETTVSYSKGESNAQKISFTKTTDIIYNGERGVYSEDMFKNVKIGNFKFISTNNKDYDVIVINDFKTMTVGKIDKTTKVLSDADDESIKLDLNSADKKVIIYDSQNNIVNFQFIAGLDVLTYLDNTNFAEVYISGASKSGEIQEISSVNSKTVLKVNDELITLNAFATEKYKNLTISSIVKCTLDYFGEASYITVLNKDGYERVYLLKVGGKTNTVETDLIMRTFSAERGLQSIPVPDKINFNGVLKKNLSINDFEKLFGNSLQQMIALKYNEKKELTHIETALNIQDIKNSSIDGFCRTHKLGARRYVDDPANLDRTIILNSNTQIMRIPTDIDNAEEGDYAMINISYLSKGNDYTVEAYNSSKDYQIPENVIIKMSMGAGGGGSVIKDEDPCGIVKSKVQALNKQGTTITRVYVQQGDNQAFFDLDPGKEPIKYTLPNGNIFSIADIDVGDLIQFSKDGRDFVQNFKIHMDYSNNEWLSATGVERAGFIPTKISTRTGDYIRVPHWFKPDESDGMFDLKERTATISGVTVVEKRPSGKPFVRAGSFAEIEKGDDVVIQIAYTQLIGIVIYR